jgi:hypothetical protein
MSSSIHRCVVASIGGLVRAMAAASSAALLMAAPRTAAAQVSTCRLVDSADVISLFGQSADPKVHPVSGDCMWGAVGVDRRGLTMSISVRDTAITNVGYTRGHELAANNGPITDEPGLGDRGYSAVVSFGAEITILTQGQIVQLRYANGAPGSAADVTRLRPVAANVVARLRRNPASAPPIFTNRPQ